MRKSKNRSNNPQPTVFKRRPPEDLKRVESTNAQRDYQDNTIIYGENNALPLLIAQAVEESPAASSCIETVSQFVKGSGFANKELEKIVVDEAGTTLWQLHCNLSDTISTFWGIAVNLKYARNGKISRAYPLSFESCRFRKPEDDNNPYIDTIVYNPYFGVDALYKKDFSKEYPVYSSDPKKLSEQMQAYGKTFPGQVFYYGKTSPLSRFYPKPNYWSAKKWLYIDAKIQEAHAENMDNGFFQSVLMSMVGDPGAWSTNPRLQEEYLGENGQKLKRSTKTVGEEFNDYMSAHFSGSSKMGTVLATWAKNENQLTKIQAFPSNTNADLFLALQDLTTKNITIATRVPPILANISEGVSLGSGGSEMQKAVELMQSRTSEWRMVLENFYNEVLLPNLSVGATKEKVVIQNYNPITQPVELDKQFWDFLNTPTKKKFIETHFPSIEWVEEVAAPAPDGSPAPVTEGEQLAQPTPKVNEAMKSWKVSDVNMIQKIVSRYNLSLSDPQNVKALTFEQAAQILKSYGLTDEDINVWIVKPDEI